MRRRALLATAGTVLAAGCAGRDDATPTGTPIADHPAGRNIDAQPVRGSLDAPATLVVFQNVTCDLCVGFETGPYPELREKLVDPGKLAVVSRNVGPPYASTLFEAVAARDEATFWKLKRYVYRNFLDVRDEGFTAVARAFLHDSALDADATIDAARTDERYRDRFYADRTDAREAGIDGKFGAVAFRDGRYRTTITAPHDYDVFARALGVEG